MQNSDLQESQDPQLPDLKAAKGRSRQQHTDLVQCLVPEHTHTHTQSVMVHLHAASNSVNPSLTLCDVN